VAAAHDGLRYATAVAAVQVAGLRLGGVGDELRLRRCPRLDGPVIFTTPPSTDVERAGGGFCSTIGGL
jgi:hypothetical protein